MALTRVPFRDIKSNVTEISDNIVTLNSGNVAVQDAGILFDRSSNGSGSNVAIAWQESSKKIVAVYTNNSGQGSGNIAVAANANVAVGNIFIEGVFWSNGSAFASSATGPGNNNEFQYNNAGNFGSTAGITYVSSGSMQLTANLDAVTVRATTIGNVGAGILGTNVTALSSFQGAIGTFGTNTGAFAGVTATTLSTSANATLAGLTVTGTATVNGSLKSNAGLQGTAVGNVTQASGKFTTIQGTDTTDSTSTTTGALIIAGGAGIASNIYVGGNVVAGNAAITTAVTAATARFDTSTTTSALNTGTLNANSTATVNALTSNGAVSGTTGTFGAGVVTTTVDANANATVAGLTVNANATINGNITASSYIISGTGIFWSNGTAYSSGGGGGGGTAFNTYTANTTPPTTGNVSGDQWYDTANDVLYEWQNDGTNFYWVDITGAPSTTTGAPVTGNTTIYGNLIPNANVAYDLGSNEFRFRSLYISGNTIDLGGAAIKTDPTSGAFAFVPAVTAATPNPTAVVFSATGGISTASTSGGNISGNAIANSAATAAPSVTTGKAIAMAIVFGG